MLRRIKGVTLRNKSVEADQGCDTKERRGERRNCERFSNLKTSPRRGMDTRFEDGRIICLKQTMKMEVKCTMGKGRPGMRWMDNNRHEMNECGLYEGAPLTEECELGWCYNYPSMRVFFGTEMSPPNTNRI